MTFFGAYFDSERALLPCAAFVLILLLGCVLAADNTAKLALEYMNRGSLQTVRDSYGPVHEVVLASISYQMLHGLHDLHKAHHLHRDIKPANALVNHLASSSSVPLTFYFHPSALNL